MSIITSIRHYTVLNISELLRFDADGELWHLYKALKPPERPRTYWHYLKMWLVPETCDTCVDVTFIPTFTAMFCTRFDLGGAPKLRLHLANRYTAAEREAVGVLEQTACDSLKFYITASRHNITSQCMAKPPKTLI